MLRASYLRSFTLFCCCVAPLAGCAPESAPDDSRNVQTADGGAATPDTIRHPYGVDLVIFVLDTLRADQLGAYGNADEVTPNLDRLARRSVVFTRAYAQSSWTKTSVASLFTGLYPVKHQVYDEELQPRGYLPERFLTLAELLQQRGYFTYAVSGNPHIRNDNGFGQGFTRFEVPRKAWRGDNTIEITELTHAALEEIKRRGDNFFLYVHYLDPHDPWVKEDDCARIMGDLRADDSHVWRGNGFVLSGEAEVVRAKQEKTRSPVPRPLSASDQEYVRRLYACETRRVDMGVGQILDRMEALGLLGNALVVVTSDHGEEFWEHGMLCHGYQLYEETVRVPLIVGSPFLGQEHAVVADSVALIDIFGTVADAVDADLEADNADPIDGAVLPLSDNHQSVRASRIIFGETRFRNQNKAYAVEGQRKILVDNNSGEQWLYDLEADRMEANSLAVEDSADALRLKSELNRYLDMESRYHWQGQDEQPQSPDEETVNRLRSLGYVD